MGTGCAGTKGTLILAMVSALKVPVLNQPPEELLGYPEPERRRGGRALVKEMLHEALNVLVSNLTDGSDPLLYQIPRSWVTDS
jgi:hypothetical protein